MDDHSITIDHEENPVNSEPCISKVHIGLHNIKPEAYKPVVVSIGPYHKANPDLQAMQQNKELYLNSLLERRNKSPESREIYLAMLKLNSEARKCYVDPYPVNSNDEFAEMMLLDGCFIVEFLRKMDDEVKDVNFDFNDPISRVPWMKSRIQCDMMLLENQLPYFVLSKVYNTTKSPGEKPLEEMVMSCFNTMLPRPRLNSNNAFGNKRINHLLHLVLVDQTCTARTPRFSCLFDRIIAKIQGDQTCTARTPRFSCLFDRIIAKIQGDQTCTAQNNDSGSEMKNQMGTVVELQEAGVKFKKFDKIYNGELNKKKNNKNKKEEKEVGEEKKEDDDDYVSLFDIDFKYEVMKVPCFKCGVMKAPCFKCGVMKVPCFKVDDTTETLLRNLIAYEQHFPNVYRKYFTDFACLMNQLINSREDAKVLRFEGIIMNFLGGDDELSQLFNTLTDNVCESPKPYYDLDVRQKVDEHCKTPCNTWMAYFNRKYFYNPWAGISTFAAALLLVLTVAQFIVALYTLKA